VDSFVCDLTRCLFMNSLESDFCSVTKDGTHKLPQKYKIVETFWHDHSLESCWGALFSDGTIICRTDIQSDPPRGVSYSPSQVCLHITPMFNLKWKFSQKWSETSEEWNVMIHVADEINLNLFHRHTRMIPIRLKFQIHVDSWCRLWSPLFSQALFLRMQCRTRTSKATTPTHHAFNFHRKHRI
jgi:hypothetical protein